MKTKILFLAFLALFFSNSNAETWSMKYCKNVSAQVNSNLPMNVDSVTDLINTFCLPTKYGPEFNYKYTVDDSIELIPDVQRDTVMRSWCTTPDLMDMLKGLSGVRFSYYQINGNFVGVVSFSYKDCK